LLTANGKLKSRELDGCSAVEQILPQWEALWKLCPNTTSFQRPQWLLAWMQAFQPREPLLIEVRHDDRLIGFAPFFVYTSGSERILALMGGGVSDYLDVLVDPAFEAEVLALIWQHIDSESSRWSRLDLTDLPSASPLLRMQNDVAVEKHLHDACPILSLQQQADDLKATVPAHQLRNLRNARARLNRAGDGRIEVATRETLPGMLDSLFHLHGSRWAYAGFSGVLCDATVQSFHRHVAPRLLDQDVLRLYGLRLNGRLIASLYAFFEPEVAYCYLQAFDPEFKTLSPGTQILGAVIEDAVKQGKRSIDFLRGREAYKYAWGARDVATFRLQSQMCALRTSQKTDVAA
jgi:CelD/BcsL family acetyltransferase involved in cellulose biosynthesis